MKSKLSPTQEMILANMRERGLIVWNADWNGFGENWWINTENGTGAIRISTVRALVNSGLVYKLSEDNSFKLFSRVGVSVYAATGAVIDMDSEMALNHRFAASLRCFIDGCKSPVVYRWSGADSVAVCDGHLSDVRWKRIDLERRIEQAEDQRKWESWGNDQLYARAHNRVLRLRRELKRLDKVPLDSLTL
jgi:hypothetical protein